jgi:CRP-like cAMP-binding protein
MPKTLQDLRDEADRRLANEQPFPALKVYRLVLEAVPLDFDLRLDIGDVIAELGGEDLAAAVYRSVAEHDVKDGNPLRAIAALKRSSALNMNISSGFKMLIDKYSAGSKVIGRGLRRAPPEYDAEVKENLDLDYFLAPDQLMLETARMAAYLDNIESYPAVVPPIQIFSTLEPDAFTELFKRLKLKRYKAQQSIIRQGDPGHEVYFLARGKVSVMVRKAASGGDQDAARVARLGPGSLFGEMAIVSDDPRSASVVCDTPVDVLELTRKDIDDLADKMPNFAEVMARFTRERMINNLLSTNPLFKPFDEDSRKELLARFTGHEVPKGTIFLEEGNVGNGLYVVLQGRAEVLKWNGKEHVKVADLGPGDVAGEISVLFEEPVSATVRTKTRATLLFLARELFLPLVETFPEVLAHFNKLAEERLADTKSKIKKTGGDKEPIDEIDELELTDDDIVLI